MNSFHIRPYQADDLSTLLEVFRQNVPSNFDPTEEQDLIEYLQTEAAGYVVLEEKGKIIGGAGTRTSKQGAMGHITWIFFSLEKQGMGLGRMLMEDCLGKLEGRPGLLKIVVTTSQLAWQFFGKFGFELIRTQKDYWGEGLDLYYMEKGLP